ncbi:hypothetical protein GCM10022233_40240 [Streptomyces shaanxiensis]|uniref:Uncharacterized protein n=1 Tax=Streptomyces shaanxiensis TaxID=653357 RepID=A0ABP7VBG5_9ACTN
MTLRARTDPAKRGNPDRGSLGAPAHVVERCPDGCYGAAGVGCGCCRGRKSATAAVVSREPRTALNQAVRQVERDARQAVSLVILSTDDLAPLDRCWRLGFLGSPQIRKGKAFG